MEPTHASSIPLVVTAAPPPPLPWWNFRRWGWNFLTLSIVGHILFGVLAAFLIVATINGKRKQDFLPPGPKGPNAPTRALEHKVSMAKKQNTMSAPPNAKRITTTGLSKVSLPAMPSMKVDTVMPMMSMGAMGGSGAGLGGFGQGGGSGGGGGGGGGLSLFGLRAPSPGLVGTFYDLKQNRSRGSTNMTPQIYAKEVSAFLQGGWNAGVLSKYYQGPQPVYAQQVFIPTIPADLGPSAFGLEKEVQPRLWLVHYKGNVTPTESGTYHFVGAGDDVMNVRFNNKLVLSRNWDNPQFGVVQANWRPQSNIDYHWPPALPIPNGFAKGDGIAVEAGTSYPMEVLIGEQPGGFSFAALLIERDGDNYQQDQYGNNLYPVFRLTKGPLPPPMAGAGYAPHAEEDGPMWKSVSKDAGPKSIFDH